MKLQVAMGAVVVASLVAVGLFVWPGIDSGDDDSTGDGTTFVVAEVERRDLADEVTVRGEIRRDELQRLTSGIDGRVSSVNVDDGDTVSPGDVIFALDGRAAVAVNGDFSFFRELDVGSDGPDVLQLERILADQGYQVGIVDQLFTEDTRGGLRRWQVDRGYGGATPEPDENIVISLQSNPAGYTVGAKNTLSLQLGPTVPNTSQDIERSGADTSPVAEGADGDDEVSFGEPPGGISFLQTPPPVPAIEVRASPSRIAEGEVVTFTFTSDLEMPVDTIIDYTISGTATGGAGGDYDNAGLDGTFVFPAGAVSVDLAVVTLTDEAIEGDEAITITVGSGLNPGEHYRLGPLKEATAIIAGDDDDLAEISVRSDQAATNEGGVLTFTFEADRVRTDATTIFFRLGGSARNGSDYNEISPRQIELPAGVDSVTLTVQTRNDALVEPDETVVVELNTTRRRARYTGGDNQRASAIIEADPRDLPELSISGGGAVGEGEAAGFTVFADQPVVVDTSINYAVGGSATPGRDYQELTGTVIMAAGTSSVSVGIRTLDDDVVFKPGDMIVADWPARIGTVSVDEGEFILRGQEVLTLTEPDFTITLILSPTDRGRLAVGMSVQVELQASDQDPVPGFIAELDDTATIDDAGNESYEGAVEAQEELEAVDGAGVNVDVTLDERLDVLTVPVAAVLQDGEGNDVVRVVLTDGTTRQVRVDVGLSEGAFVEIRSGLSGDELVLVET